MEYLLGVSHIVIRSALRVTDDKIPIAIKSKYISQKVLGFIATEGAGINEPCAPYLSHYPGIFSNVYIWPVLLHHVIGRYFSACNAIDNNKKIQNFEIAVEKYWVTQSGYFRLANTVTLGVGGLYMVRLYSVFSFHIKSRTSPFQWENTIIGQFITDLIIPFQLMFFSPDFNLHPIPIDDSPHPNKSGQYTSDMLPDIISVASGNSSNVLTTPDDSLQLLVTNYDDTDT